MIKEVNLNIDYEKILNTDHTVHTGSCIKHQVSELKDIHEQYGGMPPTYVFENTIIHQLWWTKEEIDFDYIGKQLGIKVITISSILQPPGCIIPWHRDTFYKIKQEYPNDPRLKVRANIYLEDWKMGQYLQYDNTVSTHWQQGEGLMWDDSVVHLSANAGFESKYTMQVSGFLNE